MAKTAPTARLFVAGYDISGDVGAIDNVAITRPLFDVTGADKSAVERIYGTVRDGDIGFSSWWDVATGYMFDALAAIPTTDQYAMLTLGVTAGSPAANLIAKQANFAMKREQGGALSASTSLLGNGRALEWGNLLTTGKQTFSGAGNGTAWEETSYRPTAKDITSSSVANPTVITCTGHGMISGDSVLIAGHEGSTPAVDGSYTVTRVNDDTFTVPVNVSSGGTGGTATKTSTNHGAAAYLQVFSIGSGTVNLKVQDSADNSTYADVTGLGFTGATGRTVERVATSSSTAIIRAYTRLNVSGTFTAAVVAVAICRFPLI